MENQKLPEGMYLQRYTGNQYAVGWDPKKMPSTLAVGWDTYKDSFLHSYPLTEEYMNSNCVSELLATDNWRKFAENATSNGKNLPNGLAIGSPTLEMWMASWNAKYDKEFRYITASIPSEGYGYDLGDAPYDDRHNSNYQMYFGGCGEETNQTGRYDPLYFWEKDDEIYGYKLSSPINYDNGTSVYIDQNSKCLNAQGVKGISDSTARSAPSGST